MRMHLVQIVSYTSQLAKSVTRQVAPHFTIGGPSRRGKEEDYDVIIFAARICVRLYRLRVISAVWRGCIKFRVFIRRSKDALLLFEPDAGL